VLLSLSLPNVGAGALQFRFVFALALLARFHLFLTPRKACTDADRSFSSLRHGNLCLLQPLARDFLAACYGLTRGGFLLAVLATSMFALLLLENAMAHRRVPAIRFAISFDQVMIQTVARKRIGAVPPLGAPSIITKDWHDSPGSLLPASSVAKLASAPLAPL